VNKKPRIASTRHVLPFSELSPTQFERLCLWLVDREGFKRPEHFGESGSEQGRDVVGYKTAGAGEELWYFQCKRYKEIGANTLRVEVDKITSLGRKDAALRPVGIVFVTNALVSARTRGAISNHCRGQGFACEFWARSELDLRVKKYKDLVEEFFGQESSAGGTLENNSIRQGSVAVGGNVTEGQVVVGDHNVILHFHEPTPHTGNAAHERPTPWNLPYRRNPFFTGRDQVLRDLHEALTSGQTAALTQAISGLGGIGKTQTAVEYAYRYRDDYKTVIWIRAESESSIISAFVEVATLLDLPEKDAKEPQETIRAVWRWLASTEDWLLVCDNADQPEQLKPYLPIDPKGRILITSRAQVFHGLAKAVRLEVLTPEAALEFLLKRVEREDHSAPEKHAAVELSKELGYLPLALEQAGAFISEKGTRFQDYLASYRKRRLELLDESKPIAGDYERSVATTWSMNFTEVEQTSPASSDLLRFSAYLDPDCIPLTLISKSKEHLGPRLSAGLRSVEEDPLMLDSLLHPLTRYSLLHRDVDRGSYSIHRMVQEAIKSEMGEAEQYRWAERAVLALDTAFPYVEYASWPLCETLLPHAAAAAIVIDEWRVDSEEAAHLLNQVGFYYNLRGRYEEAEHLLERALIIWEKTLGAAHPNVATTLNNLAGLYDRQGRYKEGEPLYKQALGIWEKVLGPDHFDVAACLNNLAMLYYNQANYEEAEHLFERSLDIWERELGPDHPTVAQSLNNLALLYAGQARLSHCTCGP
jgi:tetratricopeptide (TPR) repeat protein